MNIKKRRITLLSIFLFLGLFLIFDNYSLADNPSHAVNGPVCDSNSAKGGCTLGEPCYRKCDSMCTAPGAWCNASSWTASCNGDWYDVKGFQMPVECCKDADCPEGICDTSTHTCSVDCSDSDGGYNIFSYGEVIIEGRAPLKDHCNSAENISNGAPDLFERTCDGDKGVYCSSVAGKDYYCSGGACVSSSSSTTPPSDNPSHAVNGPVCDSNSAKGGCTLGEPCYRKCDSMCTATGAWCDASSWTSSCNGDWYDVKGFQTPVECCNDNDCSEGTCDTSTHKCSVGVVSSLEISSLSASKSTIDLGEPLTLTYSIEGPSVSCNLNASSSNENWDKVVPYLDSKGGLFENFFTLYFNSDGVKNLTLTCQDATRGIVNKKITVTVNPSSDGLPIARIVSPRNGSTINAGESVSFVGSGTGDISYYKWYNGQNCGCGAVLLGTHTSPTGFSHTFPLNAWAVIALQVVDTEGNASDNDPYVRLTVKQSSASKATCNNRVQDAGEFGVDCGGDVCPACNVSLPAPTNLSATCNNGTISVNWSGVSGADRYNLIIDPKNNQGLNSTQEFNGDVTGTSYQGTVSGGQGASYYYGVRAVKENGTNDLFGISVFQEVDCSGSSDNPAPNPIPSEETSKAGYPIKKTVEEPKLEIEVQPGHTYEWEVYPENDIENKSNANFSVKNR